MKLLENQQIYKAYFLTREELTEEELKEYNKDLD